MAAVAAIGNLVRDIVAASLGGPVNPTGAGGTYSAAYLVARVSGAGSVEAARTAAQTVADLLAP